MRQHARAAFSTFREAPMSAIASLSAQKPGTPTSGSHSLHRTGLILAAASAIAFIISSAAPLAAQQTGPATLPPQVAPQPQSAPVQAAPAAPQSTAPASSPAPEQAAQPPAADTGTRPLSPTGDGTLPSQPVDGQEAVPISPANDEAQPDATGGQVAGSPASLPHDLSPWGMFMAADIIVKGVMIGLFVASIITWTVGLAKSLELLTAGFALRRALDRISGERSLYDAIGKLRSRRGLLPAMLDATAAEVRISGSNPNPDGVKERVASRLGRIEAAAARSIARGTGVLATIGSTAPFVGLFGTVWGIMNSFIGISKAQTTNLAVVAPGIAEALLATAIGLVAAIPAVMIYNQFARWIAGYRLLVGDASAQVQRLVSRDLDRAGIEPQRSMRAAE